MMPSSFEEQNGTLSHPESMTEDAVSALVIHTYNGAGGLPITTSCWRLTEDELREVNKTGRVWLTVLGPHAPVSMSGVKPVWHLKND